MKISKEIKTIIVKYITNSISSEELDYLSAWLQEPENKDLFNEYLKINYAVDFDMSEYDKERAKNALVKKIRREKSQLYSNRIYKTVKYAAVILIVFGLSIAYISKQRNNTSDLNDLEILDEESITLQLENGSLKSISEDGVLHVIDEQGKIIGKQKGNQLIYSNKDSDELVYNQLTVPYGKRFQLVLSDGTKAHLNAGSSLKYPINFLKNQRREIFLKGEAFLEVTKDDNRPFIVHTENMNVRVLGTKFNVSSYANENNTSAVLVEGSVGVYRTTETFDEEKSIIISPEQQITFKEDEFTVKKVNVYKHIAWVEGRLYFVNDYFKNIIKELERHYNITMENNSPELNNIRYTGTFESGSTIEDILNTFKRNTQFDYRIEGDKIFIQPIQ